MPNERFCHDCGTPDDLPMMNLYMSETHPIRPLCQDCHMADCDVADATQGYIDREGE